MQILNFYFIEISFDSLGPWGKYRERSSSLLFCFVAVRISSFEGIAKFGPTLSSLILFTSLLGLKVNEVIFGWIHTLIMTCYIIMERLEIHFYIKKHELLAWFLHSVKWLSVAHLVVKPRTWRERAENHWQVKVSSNIVPCTEEWSCSIFT